MPLASVTGGGSTWGNGGSRNNVEMDTGYGAVGCMHLQNILVRRTIYIMMNDDFTSSGDAHLNV